MGYFVEGQILRDQHIGHHARSQALAQRLLRAGKAQLQIK